MLYCNEIKSVSTVVLSSNNAGVCRPRFDMPCSVPRWGMGGRDYGGE